MPNCRRLLAEWEFQRAGGSGAARGLVATVMWFNELGKGVMERLNRPLSELELEMSQVGSGSPAEAALGRGGAHCTLAGGAGAAPFVSSHGRLPSSSHAWLSLPPSCMLTSKGCCAELCCAALCQVSTNTRDRCRCMLTAFTMQQRWDWQWLWHGLLLASPPASHPPQVILRWCCPRLWPETLLFKLDSVAMVVAAAGSLELLQALLAAVDFGQLSALRGGPPGMCLVSLMCGSAMPKLLHVPQPDAQVSAVLVDCRCDCCLAAAQLQREVQRCAAQRWGWDWVHVRASKTWPSTNRPANGWPRRWGSLRSTPTTRWWLGGRRAYCLSMVPSGQTWTRALTGTLHGPMSC